MVKKKKNIMIKRKANIFYLFYFINYNPEEPFLPFLNNPFVKFNDIFVVYQCK